ncbi:MAG: hypothetical protein ACODAD_07260 [Planctomycetota bacterium]
MMVRDGELHLTALLEDRQRLPQGYHTFTTAAVKSKTLVKYGYYSKCKRCIQGPSSSDLHSTPPYPTTYKPFSLMLFEIATLCLPGNTKL